MSADKKTQRGFLLAESQREQAVEPQTDLSLLRRLIPYFRINKTLFIAALALIPIATVAGLIQPLFLKKAIDSVVSSHDKSALLIAILFYGISIIVEFIVRFTQTYTMQLAGQRVIAKLRMDVWRHINRLRLGYFDRTPLGRIVTRVTNDMDGLQEVFASGAVTAIADSFVLIGVIIFMLMIDVELTLITMLVVPPLIWVVNLFRKRARNAFRAIRVHTAALNAYLAEQVQGIAVLQAYGREAESADEYTSINRDYRDANYAAIRYDALLFSVVESLSVACVAIILWYAARKASLINDTSTSIGYIGTVVAFYDYIQRFFVPVRDLSMKYTIIQSALASCERIFGILDVQEFDAPKRTSLEESIPEDIAIRFKDVHFAYRQGHPVLHGISFDIKRGERVAIVGATGSGKSTLTSLLLRFYERDSGLIAIDGQDICSYETKKLRRHFSIVSQDVFLIRGTVLENITLDDTPDRARAQSSLERVSAWKFLDEREGLDTLAEERGQNFSAGEKQLLALARAIYHDAPYLILDEATANVDSVLEAHITKATEEVMKNRTSLIIAHRLSTIQNADRILVLHQGNLVEEGTHVSLLAKNGVYTRLHELQTRLSINDQ